MRTLWFVLCVGQLVLAHAQTFNRRYDTFGQMLPNGAWCIDRHADGGFMVAAYSQYTDTLFLYTTAALVRLDEQGHVLSESKMLHPIAGIFPGWSNTGDSSLDGGIILGGGLEYPDDVHHGALIRYNSTGDSLWLREYIQAAGDLIGRQAKACKDGGFVLCGEIVENGNGDGFVLKTDSGGAEQWRRTYGGEFLVDYVVAIDTTEDDGYFVGGEFRQNDGNLDLWVLRITGTGDTLWTTTWGGEFDEPNAHLTTLANGNPVIASAWGLAPDFALTRSYMAELDQSDGSIIWERQYGTPSYLGTLYTPKEVRPGEGCIAAGYVIEGGNTPFYKGVMLRTAANGDSIWLRSYFYYDSLMTNGKGYFRDVVPTQDGGFIACGAATNVYEGTLPPGYDNQDIWVVKVDSLGCLVPGCEGFLGITAQITNLGHALSVYPNPLSPSKGQGQLHVGINLPTGFRTEGPLNLSVVGMDGKLVRQEVVPTSQPNELVLDVTGLAAGAYTVHLSDAHTWIAGKNFVVE